MGEFNVKAYVEAALGLALAIVVRSVGAVMDDRHSFVLDFLYSFRTV